MTTTTTTTMTTTTAMRDAIPVRTGASTPATSSHIGTHSPPPSAFGPSPALRSRALVVLTGKNSPPLRVCVDTSLALSDHYKPTGHCLMQVYSAIASRVCMMSTGEGGIARLAGEHGVTRAIRRCWLKVATAAGAGTFAFSTCVCLFPCS